MSKVRTMLRKLTFFTLFALLLLATAFSAFTYVSKSFRIELGPKAVDELSVVMKGVAGQLIFGSRETSPILKQTGQEGLIEAYRRDPEAFKRYAAFFDTAASADASGTALLANRKEYRFPLTTDSLKPPTLDAWGQPFCVESSESGLAFISGGEKRLKFDCQKVEIPKELHNSRRKAFLTPAGLVIVLVDEAGSGSAK